MGAPAKSFRMALGALIIKERLKTSNRETAVRARRVSRREKRTKTVEQIRANPYLQYFIGMEKYSNKEPFGASMLVHFRERIGEGLVNRINRRTVEIANVLKETYQILRS